MAKFKIDINDIVGHEVGKLKVLRWSHYEKRSHRYECLCQCGRITTVRRGDLLSGKSRSCQCFHAENDEELRNIIMRIPPQKNGCRIWPGSKYDNGYGVVHFRGKSLKAHSQSARVFLGPRPKGLVTMHKCFCKSCCEPTHLEYGTHSQNHKDAYKNEGKARRGEALSLEKARQIRAIYPRITQKEISKKFGCSPNLVSQVINNKIWKETDISPEEDDWSSEGHEQMDFNFYE